MKNIEAVNIYKLLSGCKVDKIEKKEDRWAFMDIVMALSKVYNEYVEVEQKAAETMENVQERNEYMGKYALADVTAELPSVSKEAVYELVECNNDRLNIGAIAAFALLVK